MDRITTTPTTLEVAEPIWDKVSREIDVLSAGLLGVPQAAESAVFEHPLRTGGQFLMGAGLSTALNLAAQSQRGWLRLGGRAAAIGLGVIALRELGGYINETYRVADDTWRSPVNLEINREKSRANLAPFIVESAVMMGGAHTAARLQARFMSGALETRLPMRSGEPLPAYTSDGFLPPGIHKTTWAEFAERYGGSPRRQELLRNMEMLMRELRKHEGGDRVFVGGSFVTNKPVPNDFDMTWRVSGQQLGVLQKKSPILTNRTLQKDTLGGQLMATYPNSPGDGVLGFLQKSRANRPIGVVEIELSSLPADRAPSLLQRGSKLLENLPSWMKLGWLRSKES